MRSSTNWRNWSRSLSCTPQAVARPETEADVVAIVESAKALGRQVRVVGGGRSFAPLVPTDGILLGMERVHGLVRIDEDSYRATFRGGTTVAEATRLLAHDGLALPTLGTSRTATLAGIVATGTHGSMTRRPCAAADVVSFRLVTASGEVLHCDRDTNPEVFRYGRIALGVLGVVTELTFQCLPAFALRVQRKGNDRAALVRRAPRMVDDWSYATAWWRPWTDSVVMSRAEPTAEEVPRRRIGTVAEEAIAAGLLRAAVAGGIAGGSLAPTIGRLTDTTDDVEVLRHSASVITVAQTVRFEAVEYAVPLADLGAVLESVRHNLADEARRLPWPIEIRMSEGDDVPLSLAEGRRTAYLNLPVSPWHARHSDVLHRFDAAFEDFDARPHLAKVHFLDDQRLWCRYPGLSALRTLRHRMDPTSLFGNGYVDQLLNYGPTPPSS